MILHDKKRDILETTCVPLLYCITHPAFHQSLSYLIRLSNQLIKVLYENNAFATEYSYGTSLETNRILSWMVVKNVKKMS